MAASTPKLQFMAVLIKRDHNGVWWADMDDQLNLPQKFPEIPNRTDTIFGFPKYVLDKLAVLQMAPPSKDPINGIGRRVDENTFWVYLENYDD